MDTGKLPFGLQYTNVIFSLKTDRESRLVGNNSFHQPVWNAYKLLIIRQAFVFFM